MSTQIHVSRILSHPANIRETLGDEEQLTNLAASIKSHGILQPLIVHRHASDKNKYVILAGHRRFAAAQRAGLDRVPCIIREQHATWAEATEIMLVENVQRRDLNPMEKAEAMGALLNAGYSQVDIAKKVGLSVATVNYYVALLDLDPKSRELVRNGDLSANAASKAVRTVRQVNRMMQGRKLLGPEPKSRHFGFTHPLAEEASARCDHQKERVIVGRVACGECWEHVIRRNARKVDR